MSLRISSINSGSNGNCYYIGNDHEAVLVDAGISCREITKRMSRVGLDVKKVRAIFVSHEHSDHINGVEVFSRKYRVPVYVTQATQRGGGLKLEKDLLGRFSAYQPVQVGSLAITAFPKFHDCADPSSFLVSNNDVTVGVFTDIGHACENVIRNFRKCDAAFLETNYDEEMLATGNYPIYLKRRIASDLGHLSNRQALELFRNHRSESLSHLLLSHLSRENNSPQLVQKLFEEHAGNVKVTVASRDYESEVFHIQRGGSKPAAARQISMFQEETI